MVGSAGKVESTVAIGQELLDLGFPTDAVPLYNDVSSSASLPSLRLDLHVYAATPQERFVMINMHKLHEGDLMTAEGVRVESITPYGAVLSRNGTKFLLPRD